MNNPIDEKANEKEALERIAQWLSERDMIMTQVAVGVVDGDVTSIRNFFRAGTHEPAIRIVKKKNTIGNGGSL